MTDSDECLGRLYYWRPGVTEPRFDVPQRSGLKIGLIGSGELLADLDPEGEVYLLSPASFDDITRFIDLDLLLVESAWWPTERDWRGFQRSSSTAHKKLLQLLKYAARTGTPSAFWLTDGSDYVPEYLSIARHFDAVFCADATSTHRFAAEGVEAIHLPIGVQPERYHPFQADPYRTSEKFSVYFDGWADLDRGLIDGSVLRPIADKVGLAIFESRYRLSARRLRQIPKLAPYVYGCLSPGLHRVALQRSAVAISVSSREIDVPSQQRLALKAAACGAALVHMGELPDGDLRSEIVRTHTSRERFAEDASWLAENRSECERVQHATWRYVLQKHTVAHRLQSICDALGIGHEWDEWPSVTVVTPTRRPERLEQLVRNYDAQIYPNKELHIVLNGDTVPDLEEWKAVASRGDVKIDMIPEDRATGACMNRAHERSQAKYIVKMDDDDLYGENYLLDIALSTRCVSADVFGKVPAPIRFEEEKAAYRRQFSFNPWSIVSGRELRGGGMWLGGNTLGYRREALENPVFPEDVLGSADSAFNQNCPEGSTVLFLDPFNVVTARRADPGSHTWQVERSALRRNAEVVENGDDVVF